ncbi:MAG TPA: FAD-binding oxidoreductase [Candidatus Binataceae bacterium]|nr:FAD-binding oxidoreductase [Candidatus Binataceae bacterium]
MSDILSNLAGVVGADGIVSGDALGDYTHDEALSGDPCVPIAVVRPADSDQVSRILRLATEHHVPVTARGSGTGLSGACVPRQGGIVVSFERMKRIVEVDTANHTAIVEAGVTLDELNKRLEPDGLVYPVFPGENSASLGGNVATNAGGMRAVKYGVTRHNVLGLEAVLPTGEIIHTGGKFVKASTGYDLTQLIIGSEGTLALVTQVIVKLVPRLAHGATLLAPFRGLEDAIRAVPAIVVKGIGPLLIEYIDQMTMIAITAQSKLELGISDKVRAETQAYLLVVLEESSQPRIAEDMEAAGAVLTEHGAIDVYVLQPGAAQHMIEARERSFWTAKASQASDVIDIVVPRAVLPEYMQKVREIALHHQTMIPGCGHAGDGNVHLAVFQHEKDKHTALLRDLFTAGLALGGMISGEHGIGTVKKDYFMKFEDPVKIALMRRIKGAFDPANILNPGKIFD